MTPILKSTLGSYFEAPLDINDLSDLFLLDEAEASEVWKSYVDPRATGLYDLSNDSWVVCTPWSTIGEWLDAYNGIDESNGVFDALEKASGWQQNEPLLLIQNHKNIVSLTFFKFARYWQELFAAFDDGPILISRNGGSRNAFRFVPLGQILQASVLSA